MANFVKPDVIAAAADVTAVDFRLRANQKDDGDLTVGRQASNFLQELEEDADPAIARKFFKSARAGYTAAVEKILKKFPFDSEVLKAVPLLDVNSRLLFSTQQVLKIADTFQSLSDEESDELLEEWQDFQVALYLDQ